MKYRPDIDGLRAIAVLSVLGFHAFPNAMPGGFVGVDIFFVISGFLISTIIFGHLAEDRFSILDFYNRRIRRIFPALIVVMTASLVAGWFVLFADEYRQLGKHVAAGTAFISNLILWRENGYFDNAAETKPMLHLWSLAVEEQFYIFWPVMLHLLWKKKSNFLRMFVVVGLLSFAVNIYLLQRHPDAAFFWPITRFWELMIGGFLAYASLYRPDLFSQAKNLQSVLGFVLLASGFIFIDKSKPFPSGWALLPTLGAFFIISAGPTTWLNRHLLSNRLAVAVGLISYPLYLWHWPLLTFLRISEAGDPGTPSLLAALCVAILLAWLTFMALERKIRFSRSPLISPVLLSIFGVLFLTSEAILFSGGLPDRAVAQTFDSGNGIYVFDGSRKSDGSCARQLKTALLAEEVCLTSTGSPKILFAGDSQAMALYSSIYAKNIKTEAALISAHSCKLYPSLDYTPTYRNGFDNNCTAIAQKVVDFAKSTDSVEAVVLVNYTPELDDSISRYRQNGSYLTNRQASVRGADDLIDELLKTGKKIIFNADVPHLRLDPKSCVSRLPFVDAKECRYSKVEQEKVRNEYMQYVRDLKQRHPRLIVYDPMGFFCPDEMCRSKEGEHNLYNDTHHVSVYGSATLLRKMSADGVLKL